MRIQGLGLDFPGPLVVMDQLDLAVPEGEFLAVVGPSGCGKSTLLRLVAGLARPTRGEIRVAGQPPEAARRSAARVSLVFQDATLLPWRTVAENVRLPLELARAARSQQDASVREGLDRVGLTPFAAHHPAELSGGMRMRAALARALVTQPTLLLLDEPFGALDDITREGLNEELSRLWRERRFTAIFVTHNIAEAVFLSQRVLVLSPRPARIVADVRVDLGQIRGVELRSDPEFTRLAGVVSSALRSAMP